MSPPVGVHQPGKDEPSAAPAVPEALGAAPAPGRNLSRADILRLQQTAGNAAVATLMRQRAAPPPAEEVPAEPAAPEPVEEEVDDGLEELPPFEGFDDAPPAREEGPAEDDDPAGAPLEGAPQTVTADMGPGDDAVDEDVEEEVERPRRPVARAATADAPTASAAQAGPPGAGTTVGVAALLGPTITQVHKGRSARSKVVARLEFNDKVFVVREEKGGWYFVTLRDGRYGYVDKHHIKTNLPEPSARLYRIPDGKTGLEVADALYGKYVKPGRDLRFFVNVLEYVNRGPGLRGIYQPDPSDKTTGAWKNVKTTAGYYIWVPGISFATELAGKVSSGSITGGVFAQARGAIEAVQNFAIGGAAFVAGLLDGAVTAVWDLLTGIKDALKAVWGVLKSLFEGNILRDAKRLWEVVKELDVGEIASSAVKDFAARWTHKDIWTRWKFRGKAVGYAIAEIAMILISGGGTLALKLGGKLGKLGSKLMGAVRGFTDKVKKAAPKVKADAKRPLSTKLVAVQKAALPRRPIDGPDHYAAAVAITDGSDIKRIAQLTDLPEQEVRAAKHHLMVKEHILVDDEGKAWVGRFDPYERVGDAWVGIAQGKEVDARNIDFLQRLIRHEFEESELMKGRKLQSLEQAFFEGKLDGMLRKFLEQKTDLDADAIKRLLRVEPSPVSPYRYAHLVTHYTKAENPR